MDLEQIKELVKQGESHTLEFKKSTSQLQGVFQTLCGFLNGQGGTVLIGVSNEGKIVGQKVTDNTRKEIAKEINKIEPPVPIDVIYVPIANDKSIIVLEVRAEPYSPYVFDARPFHRNQSTTSRMPQHQYEQLLVKRNHLNYAWDERFSTGYKIEDLDQEEIFKTLNLGIAV